ncbi:ATP-binding cassette domain-containing protein [Butyrivibrio sp. AC2005]|uniref:ATP-binding cassette domain-containing protein n=1 Tax=Butyrivibrio sp. AC2005 TaxID=1280672 RepID=UPI000419AB7F|nr:ABC transporter ATP-binding protein [Butyrivibrio sp. AC2005]
MNDIILNVTPSVFGVIAYILISIGYWNIFKKCGVKPYLSFIPIVREYNISLCADKEEDGKNYIILAMIYYVLEVLYTVFKDNVKIVLFLFIFLISAAIALFIYHLRINLGLIKVFGRSKKWIWAFIFCETITVLIFGLSKNFVPTKKVDIVPDKYGVKGLDQDINSIDDGLTVNISEKTSYFYFKKKTLLKDIHMNIKKGHMVLLLGGSGAGKTTFLNAITGYEKAKANITLGDIDVYKDYGKMIYDVGFVPQQDLVRGNDTVTLTLADAAALRLPSNIPLKERSERIDKVLDQFGLTVVKHNLVDKLSGGQKKRVSIAMEFISDPTLFILDEPDSGLDGVVARSLFQKLRAIADEGKIVIVITHTPDRVVDLFDDVIVLIKDKTRTGRLAFYGPVKESYEFFDENTMEGILRKINPKDVGGDGRGEEFVEKYAELMKGKVG